jgi:hypothetical protein
VPDWVKEVPVPADTFTVTVPESTPVVEGVKEIAPVVQEPPAAMVVPAVQVPAVPEKSVVSVLVNTELAAKVTGPPVAVRVTVPQETVAPTVEDPHETAEGEAERVPFTPLPEALKVALAAELATVMVVLCAPVDDGVKEI